MMASRNDDNSPSLITLVGLFLFVFFFGKIFIYNDDFKSANSLPTVPAINNNIPFSNTDVNLTKLDLPENGSTKYFSNSDAIAPFKIETDTGRNYFIKLVDVNTNNTVVTVFVHENSVVEIKVPLGTYELRYATGIDWFGDEHLFGYSTSYYKADKLLEFYIKDYMTMGHNIKLIKQIDGNMPTKPISKDSF